MRRTSFKKKKFSLPFCRCVRPRDFCDFFSLSTALSTQIEEGKKIDTFEEMDDLSPWYAFNQQRVLRKGRTEKKSISFSTVPTTGEFVINTRFFCVAFSDADSFVWEREIPLFCCVLLCSRQRRKENLGGWIHEKKTKPEHIFRQNVRLHQSTFLLPPFCEKALKTSEDTRPNAR